jgi:HNH endonuclease
VSTERDQIFGCELATGRPDREGYAFHGRTRAHIAAWTAARGAIEPGLELDHLCRRRHCIALHHLELVTRGENELRKSWRYRARRVLCPAGHQLAVHGIVTPEGGRVCRQCNRDAERTIA